MGLRVSKSPGEQDEVDQRESLIAAFADDAPPGSLDRAFAAGNEAIDAIQADQDSEAAKERQRVIAKNRAEHEQAKAEAAKAAVDKKEIDIAGGSKEPAVVIVDEDTQSFVDQNPNNQVSNFDRANDALFKALGDTSNITQLQTLMAEDKANEDISRRKMQETLAGLKARKTGLDLSPLAALIDDPNKAAVLARGLSPALSEEEKAEQVLELELKLQDRKDRFSDSRNKLKASLIGQQRQQSVQLAQAAVNAANAKEMRDARADAKATARLDKQMDRQTKFLTKAENTLRGPNRLGKDIQSINTLGGMLDKINPDEGGDINNALASSLIRFDLIRAVQPGGVITDADLKAASASPALMNRVRTQLRTWKEGIVFTREDQLNIAKIMRAAIIAKSRVVRKGIDSETASIQKRYKSSDGSEVFNAEDLRKPGEQFDYDNFIDPTIRPRVEEFIDKSETVFAGKEFKEKNIRGLSSEEDDELKRLKAERDK